jgi:putative aldouronate transport system permease protein
MTEKIAYRVISHIILMLVTLSMFLPLLLVVISSVTDESTLVANGYSYFPAKLSFGAYQYLMMFFRTIASAYGITIFAAVVGTSLSIIITAMMGYTLSIKGLPGKNVISFFVFFTILFNGGLVPSYIMWTSYFKITNSLFAYIFPFLLANAFNILLIRTYFESNIPAEIYESAKIDGAGYFRIFWDIALSLGKPILVTVGLFTGIGTTGKTVCILLRTQICLAFRRS